MKLTYKPGKADKIHIHIDGEYRMTVDKAFVQKAGLVQGQDIDEGELAELCEAVSSRRAFNKACDLLERRDHSSGELLVKLRQKGFGDHAEQAVEKLVELGYVDDERFARAYVSELIRLKHYGKRRIVSELYKKGIDRSIIEAVTEDIETDSDELIALIKRKYLSSLNDEKGERRVVNALVRMGYSYSEIRLAVEAVKEEEE